MDEEVHQGAGWPILGHDKAIRMLTQSLGSGNISHAYLITGPAGVGKRDLAKAFAMSLNCESTDPGSDRFPTQPCGLCRSCGQISRDAHPDVTEINLQTQ